jgi:hypothetical protein
MDKNKSMMNLIPLAQIDRMAQEMRYGSIPVEVEVFEGKVVAVSGSKSMRKIYKKGGLQIAIEELAQKLIGYEAEKECGVVEIKLKLHRGELKEMLMQTSFRQIF